MPAKTPPPDQTPATDAHAEERPAAAPEPTTPDVPPGRLPAGTYLYTGSLPTQYLEVPLTAHPADDDRPATVFEWPFTAPDDGRWEPTKKKPNQLPDNTPAHPEGE